MLQRIIAWLLAVYISISLLIWGVSSPLIKYFLQTSLTEQGLELSADSSIRINPFLMRVTINNLQLTQQKTQQKVFAINHLVAQIALHQLLSDILKIQEFTLDGFYLRVKQLPQQLEVAGIVIANNKKNKDTVEQKTPPTAASNNTYQAVLPYLMIANGKIDLFADGQAHVIGIDELTLKDVLASTEKADAQLVLAASIDKSPIQFSSKVHFENNKLTADNEFLLQQFNLGSIQQHLSKRVKVLNALSGEVSLALAPKVTLVNNKLLVSIAKVKVQPLNIESKLVTADKSYSINVPDMETVVNNLTVQLNLAQQQAAPDLNLESVAIHSQQPIAFIDDNLVMPLKRTIVIKNIELGALSTNDKNKATPYNIAIDSNEYEKIRLAGTITPFADIPKYTLKGNISEVSLPSISPYLQQGMQLAIESGQLNTQITGSLVGTKIDGKVNIVIKGLETTTTNNEVDMLKDNAALPLNSALAMLKDDKGNLALEVPLSGSTDDPKFGIGSFVSLITKKAVMSASKSYLMKTFVPYANVISVAMSATDFILKVRFEDLPYQIKQISPNEQQTSYLKQFITLLNDKPEINVKICGISVPADADLKNNAQVTDKKVQAHLLELAKKREHAFKDYVLQHSKINSSRLLLCKPKIDTDKAAKPRISLSV